MLSYLQASMAYESAGHFEKAAQTATATAEQSILAGFYHDAIEGYTRAAALYQRENNIEGQAGALFKLAKAFKAEGDSQSATSTLQAYLALKPAEHFPYNTTLLADQLETPRQTPSPYPVGTRAPAAAAESEGIIDVLAQNAGVLVIGFLLFVSLSLGVLAWRWRPANLR